MIPLRAFGASAGQVRLRGFGAMARHVRVRASGASARQARAWSLPAIILWTLLVPLAACGKKGPPLAPLRPIPAAVTDLAARRIGPEVRIRFTLPTQNVSGGARIDLDRVDVYAVTVAAGGVVPPTKELLTNKYLIATMPVRPPPDPEEPAAEPEAAPAKEEPPAKPAVRDERPLPGERVTYTESLTDAQLKPAILTKPPADMKAATPAVPAALDPAVPTRFYVVRGRSRGGNPGAQSPRVLLPLVPEPDPPSAVKATVTEKAVTLEWLPPQPAIDPLAAAVNAQAWAAASAPPPPPAAVKPTAPAATTAPAVDPAAVVPLTRLPGIQLPPTVILPAPPRFNVYAVTDGKIADAPLNATPLTVTTFPAGEPTWNEEKCFAVRTVRSYGLVTIESAPSEIGCFTAQDTFPPAAPSGLKAVAAAGAMNLIWDANTEADLSGYVVLRGEAPGETLQPLTPAPIRETSYKDTTVTPGVRYVYAIVAVDKASPANASPQSERVEEVAR